MEKHPTMVALYTKLVELDDISHADEELLSNMQNQVERLKSLNKKLEKSPNYTAIVNYLLTDKDKENKMLNPRLFAQEEAENTEKFEKIFNLDKKPAQADEPKVTHTQQVKSSRLNRKPIASHSSSHAVVDDDNMRSRVNKLIRFCK